MRPSAIARSGMPTGPKYMGWWGDMGGPAQRGVYEYTLSPRQQNAMRGALRAYVFYGYKRIITQVPYFAIPFGLCYGIYAWGKSKYEFLESKEGHRLHGGAEE